MAYLFDEWQELSRFCSENESNDCVILMRRYHDELDMTEYATTISYEDSRGRTHYGRGNYNLTLNDAEIDFAQRVKKIMRVKEPIYIVTKHIRFDEYGQYEHGVIGVYDSYYQACESMVSTWERARYDIDDDRDDVTYVVNDLERSAASDDDSEDYFEIVIKIERHLV